MEMLMVSIIVIVKMTRLSERGWGDLWWSVSSTDLIMMNMIRMFEVFHFLETPNIIYMKQVVGGRVRSFVTETLCRWIYLVFLSCICICICICICVSSEFGPRMKKVQPHQKHPQDLYIWWFETHCNKGRLSVVGRSWGEVVKDPRFKPWMSVFFNKYEITPC